MWASLSGGWSPYSRRWISVKIGSRPMSSFDLGGTELEWELEWKYEYAAPSRALGGREAGREAGRDGWRDDWRDGWRDGWRDEPTNLRALGDGWRDEPTNLRALGGRDAGRELAAELSEPSTPTEPACKPSGTEPSGIRASGSMVCPTGVPRLACMLACPDACAALTKLEGVRAIEARPRDSYPDSWAMPGAA